MLYDYAESQSVAEAANGLVAVRTAQELMPDLILLDLRLPHLNGIQAAKQISQVAPDATILFLSMNKDADIVREAMNTGAKGYVLKTDAGSELWPAIETVLLQKNQYLSSGVRLKAKVSPNQSVAGQCRP
jgi:DNA-binding NarL/FixJ family response regulator